MIRLMLAVEEDLEDEDVEEAVATVANQSLVTTVEFYDIMLGTVRALPPHVTIANLTITL